MMVFSTVLQINGQPTLYSVYKNENMAFFNPSKKEMAPVLYATQYNRTWSVQGTKDSTIMQQALREISDCA